MAFIVTLSDFSLRISNTLWWCLLLDLWVPSWNLDKLNFYCAKWVMKIYDMAPQGCPIMAALKGDHLYYCYSESVKTWCTNSFIICHNQRLLAWPHANFAYSKGVWTPQSSTIATPRHRAFHWRPNHLCNANAQAAEKTSLSITHIKPNLKDRKSIIVWLRISNNDILCKRWNENHTR